MPEKYTSIKIKAEVSVNFNVEPLADMFSQQGLTELIYQLSESYRNRYGHYVFSKENPVLDRVIGDFLGDIDEQ